MITVKGVYEDGQIKLSKALELEENTDVIITFLDSDSAQSALLNPEDKADDYYEGLRAHKRFHATGNICIIDGSIEQEYPLNDYSSGGLSFFSDQTFETDSLITATYKYNAGGEILVMEFEMTIRRVVEEEEDHFLVGCQFQDNVEEELWHTVMGT